MQIVQLYSGQNTSTGDFVYRVEHPATGLARLENVEVQNIDLLRIRNWDSIIEVPLLILHHLSDPDLLPVITARQKQGLPTIYELADNFKVSYLHKPDALKTGPPDYHCIMAQLIRRCDAVQTPSVALKERFKTENSRFFVFPNLIEAPWPKEKCHGESKHLTIGWAGSARHYDDIRFYADAITDWIKNHPDVRFAVMAAPKIHALFKTVPESQLELHEGGSLGSYLAFLETLDIGLAPLLPNEFNACRSDVKFLEYASREVAPVCSHFGPYPDLRKEFQDLLLFKTAKELIEHLNELRLNAEYRKCIAQNARSYVEMKRCLRNYNWQFRLNEYDKLFVKKTHSIVPGVNFADSLAQPVVFNLLTKGIESKNTGHAVLEFKKAVSLDLENYQTYYFYATSLFRHNKNFGMEHALKSALRLNPQSIRTAQLFTQLLILSGKAERALKILNKALQLAPELPILLNLKAIALQLVAREKAALEVLIRCVALAPDLVDARLQLARLALKLNFPDLARETIEYLEKLIPESPEPQILLALLCYTKQDYGEALNHVTLALNFDPLHKSAAKLLLKINSALNTDKVANKDLLHV